MRGVSPGASARRLRAARACHQAGRPLRRRPGRRIGAGKGGACL